MTIPLNFYIQKKGEYYAGPHVKAIDRPGHKFYHISREWYGNYGQTHTTLARCTAIPLGFIGVTAIPLANFADIIYNLSVSTFTGLGYLCTAGKFKFLKKLSKRNFRMLGADCLSTAGMFITVPADVVNLCIAPMINPKKNGKSLAFNNSLVPPHGWGCY